MLRATYTVFDSALNKPFLRTVKLIFAWLAGLLIGAILASKCEASFISLMHGPFVGSISIFCAAAGSFLPLLFLYLSVYLYMPLFIFPIIFFYALSFSFSAVGIVLAYGNAAWLIIWLLLFSSLLSAPCVIYFGLKSLHKSREVLKRDMIACLIYVSIVIAIDYIVVSPFSMQLLNDF